MTEPLSQLRTIIAGSPLRDRASELLALAQPAVHLRKRMTEAKKAGPRRWFGLRKGESTPVRQALPVAVGASKLGGLPDVAAGFEWPHLKAKPLGFIGQLRCADLPAAGLDPNWPTDGLLHFFYDIEEQPWGGDDVAAETPFVRYTESTADLRPAQPPVAAPDNSLILPQFGLEPEVVPTLPDFQAPETAALGFTEAEADAYIEIRTALGDSMHGGGPDHQAGGHANNVQGDVRVEFEVYTSPDADPRTKEDWIAAAGRAKDWRLLLQVDTDDDLGVMWGDVGMIYFGIRAADLKHRRFNRTQVMMQCS
jgi:uncharacterized protein YwqG